MEFRIGDLIFRRCNPNEIENPFQSISLRDISNNLGSNCGNIISEMDDVLFNIIPEDELEKYTGKVVCILEIKSLNENNQYIKYFQEIKNGNSNNCTMQLIHDPLCCMYPHCVFRIWVNYEVVTKENYEVTLSKFNKLRTTIRQELATMIRRNSIEINFE
ncbi:MAG TPA: hypothetical protein VLZ75_04390 [Chitinophagales bacterium]|nr:hypothetical protein [Chitinophagales bacterium]